MTQEQMQFIQEACDFCEIECESRTGYSGRGMYGKETCAVVVSSALDVLSAVVGYLRDSPQGRTLIRSEIPQLDDLHQDSMGRDSIILY